jgi:hypothetical protein
VTEVTEVRTQSGSVEYRRKAAECAQKALACRDRAIRAGFAEAARRWRSLAEKKETTSLPERSGPPYPFVTFKSPA